MNERTQAYDAIAGCLVGTAVGDSIALPYEGLGRKRVAAFHVFPLKHRLIAGRGLASDDTEHTCMVMASFIESRGDIAAFQTRLARRLRWWLLGGPAGVGLATLRSCLKLWLGFRPPRSAIMSAGNGPAMRSAILGVMLTDLDDVAAHARASAEITHADPRAIDAAIIVALAAYVARREPKPIIETLQKIASTHLDPKSEISAVLDTVETSLLAEESTGDFAQRHFGDGVSGFVMQTLPVCIHAWLSYPDDFEAAIASVVACGGDTDTTAAIVGALVGTRVGVGGIPDDWVDRYADWPRSMDYLEQLAQVASSECDRAPRLNPLAILLRNGLFVVIVLAHGFRRLVPPYR